MKKKLVSLVFCMALLSSFTVSASAYDVNDIYNQVTAIRNELGYPQGNWSSLRRAVNYIADHLPSSPKDYSTTLSNIYRNTSSLASTSDTYALSASAGKNLQDQVSELNSNLIKYVVVKKDVTIAAKTNTYVNFTASDLGIPIGSKVQFEVCVLGNAWYTVYLTDYFSNDEITSLDDIIVKAEISSQRYAKQDTYVECRVAYL